MRSVRRPEGGEEGGGHVEEGLQLHIGSLDRDHGFDRKGNLGAAQDRCFVPHQLHPARIRRGELDEPGHLKLSLVHALVKMSVGDLHPEVTVLLVPVAGVRMQQAEIVQGEKTVALSAQEGQTVDLGESCSLHDRPRLIQLYPDVVSDLQRQLLLLVLPPLLMLYAQLEDLLLHGDNQILHVLVRRGAKLQQLLHLRLVTHLQLRVEALLLSVREELHLEGEDLPRLAVALHLQLRRPALGEELELFVRLLQAFLVKHLQHASGQQAEIDGPPLSGRHAILFFRNPEHDGPAVPLLTTEKTPRDELYRTIAYQFVSSLQYVRMSLLSYLQVFQFIADKGERVLGLVAGRRAAIFGTNKESR